MGDAPGARVAGFVRVAADAEGEQASSLLSGCSEENDPGSSMNGLLLRISTERAANPANEGARAAP